MAPTECLCEGSGIKSVVVGTEVVEDFCDCPFGDLMRREEEGADFEDDLPVPQFNMLRTYEVLNWFNA